MIELLLGGARSGKSRIAQEKAESLANKTGRKKIYLATGQALDKEMQNRIALHKDMRDASWVTVEEPLYLADAIAKHACSESIVLIDCLTLWLNNCLHHEIWQSQKMALLEALLKCRTHNIEVIFVSNEVGSGIVPLGELSREFVDESGWLHQELAKIADRVQLIVAGLPLNLK